MALKRFSLVPLSMRDIDSVVQLHLAGLPYSLNSKLGARHLAGLYRRMAEDPDSLVRVVTDNTRPIGVVSATLDVHALKRRLMSSVPNIKKILLFARMISRPSIFSEWLQNQSMDRPVIYKESVVNACLTAIVVDLSLRRSGAGTALVSSVDAFIAEHGRKMYYLDTRADNEPSRAFYRRLGFIEVEQRGRDIVLVKEVMQ